jgi:hypothetical protein
MAQVVESLPSKSEALCSNPSTPVFLDWHDGACL